MSIEIPQDVEASLGRFMEVNQHIGVRTDGSLLILETPWGADNVSISCSLTDSDFISDLNDVWFNPAFDAIIHLDRNTIEFIFLFVDPSDVKSAAYLDRSFTLHFNGVDYCCCFVEPSERFMGIARRTQNVPSDDPGQTVPQLPAFRDAQRISELPDRAKKYFENKVPRNFTVKASVDINKIDLIGLARHLNFISNYYDRVAPEIIIRELSSDDTKFEKFRPKRFLNKSFPQALALGEIDEIVLQLIQVARNSPARQAFVYYYQVLEYAGHYYVDEKARSQLKKYLRDPSLISCDDRRIGELFSLLTEVNHNDDVKMRRVIEDVVNSEIIWPELEHDKDFFSSELRFDGGFVLSPLIAKDTTADTWSAMWMPKLFDQFTRIRNSLVHARERRENRVILPTRKNNRRIIRYLPVIQRVAEQIALASQG